MRERYKFFRTKAHEFRFSLNEISGSLGDLGTLMPFVVSLALVGSASASGILIWFGLFYILSGFIFGIPIAVQPMKAIGALAITRNYGSGFLVASGMITGGVILLASRLKLLSLLQRVTPKSVVVGIQLALGLQLILQSIKYSGVSPIFGYNDLYLALLSFLIVLIPFKVKRFPAALLLLIIGVTLSLLINPWLISLIVPNFDLPEIILPTINDLQGGIEAAMAQIPLTMTNSLLATTALATKLFPSKSIKIDTIAGTVSAMSALSPIFGGMPMCHGAGGLAGWYRFGARTGGSMIFFGIALFTLGLFFGNFSLQLMKAFPLSILGVMLMVVGLELLLQAKNLKSIVGLFIALLTAILSIVSNMIIGVVFGFLIVYILRKFGKIVR